jgi:hypothetical protein
LCIWKILTDLSKYQKNFKETIKCEKEFIEEEINGKHIADK